MEKIFFLLDILVPSFLLILYVLLSFFIVFHYMMENSYSRKKERTVLSGLIQSSNWQQTKVLIISSIPDWLDLTKINPSLA